MTEEETEHWLSQEGEWVPTSFLMPLLGDDAAEQLLIWARATDGGRPLLRTRARVFEVRNEDGELVSGKRVGKFLPTDYWKCASELANCAAGNFRWRHENAVLTATGVEINKDDLDELIGATSKSEGSPSLRAILPANAKPADRQNEEYAHQAAELVRSGKKLSAAMAEVAPSDPMRQPDTVVRGIRRAYDAMYLRNGMPSVVKN